MIYFFLFLSFYFLYHQPQNSEDQKEDSRSSNVETKTKKTVDEMKKKIVAKFNEILIKSKIKEILEKAKSSIKEIIESIKNNLGKRPKVCINDMIYL